MALRSVLVWVRAERPPTAKSKSSSLTSKQARCGPIILNLARAYGLRAGWSTPILSSDGSVLGTFAIYWREPRSPGPHHQQIIKQITHLTAVAIERKRSAESLRASELLARGQLDALTHTLDALAQESDPDRLLEHVLRTIIEQSDAPR